MHSLDDERWLKKVLDECLGDSDDAIYKKRLEGFSMIVRNIAENMQKQVDRASSIWEKDPASPQVKAALDIVKKNLFCLKKFCEEKIDPSQKKEGGLDE